jgi:SAM-dependent methyltransferase
MIMKEKMKDLLKVLTANNKYFEDSYLDQIYDEYFNTNWLRPETAVYYFMLAKAMYKFRDYFEQPILDLGCGDGSFMTIFFGGVFDKTIDSYRMVDLNKKDIYDNFVPSPKTIVVKKPKEIVYGIDIRENVVKCAKELNVYSGLHTADIKNTKLAGKSMMTVYCNMIDDISDEELPIVFKEIHRVLNDDGCVIFTVPTEDYLGCLYYGKSIWKPKSLAFWKQFLKEHSFKYELSEPFMDKRLLQFWDTGSRPYFNKLLTHVRNHPELMPVFKFLFVEVFKHFCFDLVNRSLEGKPGFILIVARKVNK